jgi:hypothetical protein
MVNSITPHSSQMSYNPLEGDRPELSVKLHENTDEHVSIIIVHKDRPEYLNICLQSIAVTSFNNNYEIIVVDKERRETRGRERIKNKGFCKIKRKNQAAKFSNNKAKKKSIRQESMTLSPKSVNKKVAKGKEVGVKEYKWKR